ncbi:reactive intermediate/imine deaminase [Massilia eurypsychrophila]|jgi:2-iminobutanoate/2-iminopropanoate deaminase|uniref:Reactive intermediate/imine deaminase n=1 Tax=Massilia eurypsychrophila TaxID=1485217 RepID=A0A2G8TDW9_9BURK|nr:RidA family protein [Massilia eurypsychrophila]PIL44230.1 reactive intermediate/imine deaminase [Massilia eurypsychrophila]
MKLVQSAELPVPAGHYSQAVEANGLVFVSGILPSAGAVDALVDGFDAQCASVFDQAEKVLRAAGCGVCDVVQCTAYLVGVEHWPAFNVLYAGVFGPHKPARAVVPVPALHFGYLIEVQLIARKPAA